MLAVVLLAPLASAEEADHLAPVRKADVPADVVAVGAARPLGSAGASPVGLASTPTGEGYWAVDRAGRVFAFGDAHGLGAPGALNRPVVGIAATPSGGGYWLVADDGGIFTFGDARFLGSTAGRRLNRPIVGMAPTPSGAGYWLVASDGGIFAFGDARFLGSTGGRALNRPVVGMAATPSGGGYWLVADDGGIFAFGDARFFGSAGGAGLRAPVVGMARTPSGAGYWLAAANGGVFGYGDAPALAPTAVGGQVTALAAHPGGAGYWLAVGGPPERVSVWEPGGLDARSVQWAVAAAERAGARWTVSHSGTLGLLAVTRAGRTIQAPPPGWRYPMSTLAVDPDAAAPLVGPEVAAALRRGQVVMSARTAALRGAAVGDTVTFLGWDGRAVSRTVGALAPDDRVRSAELTFAASDAASFGFVRPLAVELWGASRPALDAALAAAPMPVRLGVDRTWDPPDPDDTLPWVRLKELLGEVAYRPTGPGDTVALEPGWVRAGIATESVPVLGRVTCHRAVLGPLRAALAEVANAGLGGRIVDFGGCYNPRLIRGGDSGGALSRHSLGIAVDVNASRNTFGGRVDMDPRIVEIFRRHGFAWGGTWTRADGMHFEWAPR